MTHLTTDTDLPKPDKPASARPGGLLSWLRKVFSVDAQNATLRESLIDVLDEHIEAREATDHLTEQQRAMLLNILSFGSLRIEDVMVPRADIVAVDHDEPLEELLQVLAEAGHSRIPVYRETLDDPIGMYHIKDLLPLVLEEMAQSPGTGSKQAATSLKSQGRPSQGNVVHIARSLAKQRREVLFVPPSMAVLDLFLKMQATRIHMALVIDEYGGTDGLVTIEDLVEEIVGEIEDEHDTEEGPLLSKVSDGNYLADARVLVEDLVEIFGPLLPGDDDDEDIETLGGLIFDHIGRVPQRGELIEHPSGLEFEIADADPRRIKKVRIKIIKGQNVPDADASTPPDPQAGSASKS